MKHPNGFKYFDMDKIYLCDMIREGHEYDQLSDKIEVKLQEETWGYTLVPQQEGYLTKFFYDIYLEWLLYTGYVKVKENT